MIELLNKYFEVGDSDFYICNRVKEAFVLGTMSLDDFSEIDEENTADIADYLLANCIVVPPCKVGDTVYEIVYSYSNHDIRKIIKKRVVNGIEIGKDGFIALRCGRTVVLFATDIGKSVFLTRDEAEKALKKNE